MPTDLSFKGVLSVLCILFRVVGLFVCPHGVHVCFALAVSYAQRVGCASMPWAWFYCESDWSAIFGMPCS